MVTHEDIRRSLAAAVATPPETLLAEVIAVDTAARTCDINNDGVIIRAVCLQAVTQGNAGLLFLPAVGAQVLCARIEDTDRYMVLHASEVDSAELTIANQSVRMDSNGIVLNAGTVPAVAADKLLDWMTRVYADLQTLTTLLASTPVAGNGAPLGVVFTPATPAPDINQFTDPALKH